ncbi:MAG: hypothetical protein ACYCOU_04315 [Sulfobacillus sp.]
MDIVAYFGGIQFENWNNRPFPKNDFGKQFRVMSTITETITETHNETSYRLRLRTSDYMTTEECRCYYLKNGGPNRDEWKDGGYMRMPDGTFYWLQSAKDMFEEARKPIVGED